MAHCRDIYDSDQLFKKVNKKQTYLILDWLYSFFDLSGDRANQKLQKVLDCGAVLACYDKDISKVVLVKFRENSLLISLFLDGLYSAPISDNPNLPTMIAQPIGFGDAAILMRYTSLYSCYSRNPAKMADFSVLVSFFM